nr:large subunit ribosomal protein L6 [uncultured archaeon]
MYTRIIKIPEGVEVNVSRGKIEVKGPKGQLARVCPLILEMKKEGIEITISTKSEKAKEKALVGAFAAHMQNMINGVQELYVYKLKICYVHFPMSVKVSGQDVSITNFLGEKKTKIVKLPSGVTAKLAGEIITVESSDKELAGQAVTRIEQATRVRKKDKRVFLDGIYLIERDGKPIAT